MEVPLDIPSKNWIIGIEYTWCVIGAILSDTNSK
jgi:serine/threonine protein kinase